MFSPQKLSCLAQDEEEGWMEKDELPSAQEQMGLYHRQQNRKDDNDISLEELQNYVKQRFETPSQRYAEVDISQLTCCTHCCSLRLKMLSGHCELQNRTVSPFCYSLEHCEACLCVVKYNVSIHVSFSPQNVFITTKACITKSLDHSRISLLKLFYISLEM